MENGGALTSAQRMASLEAGQRRIEDKLDAFSADTIQRLTKLETRSQQAQQDMHENNDRAQIMWLKAGVLVSLGASILLVILHVTKVI